MLASTWTFHTAAPSCQHHYCIISELCHWWGYGYMGFSHFGLLKLSHSSLLKIAIQHKINHVELTLEQICTNMGVRVPDWFVPRSHEYLRQCLLHVWLFPPRGAGQVNLASMCWQPWKQTLAVTAGAGHRKLRGAFGNCSGLQWQLR